MSGLRHNHTHEHISRSKFRWGRGHIAYTQLSQIIDLFVSSLISPRWAQRISKPWNFLFPMKTSRTVFIHFIDITFKFGLRSRNNNSFYNNNTCLYMECGTNPIKLYIWMSIWHKFLKCQERERFNMVTTVIFLFFSNRKKPYFHGWRHS